MPFDVTCQICASPMRSRRRPKPGKDRFICSKPCLSELRRRTGRRLVESGKGPPKATDETQRKAALARTGIGHGWMQGGYKVVRDGGRNIAEHRLIMERHLGRPLAPDEVVHHANEDKLDNRLENLVLCKDRSEHFREHHHHLAEVKPDTVQTTCVECGVQFKTPDTAKRQTKCRKCRRYYLRYI